MTACKPNFHTTHTSGIAKVISSYVYVSQCSLVSFEIDTDVFAQRDRGHPELVPLTEPEQLHPEAILIPRANSPTHDA